MQIRIKNKSIGTDSPVYIIAEAGLNHNGCLKYAKKMIEIAFNANIDAIKFQTFKAEDLSHPSSPYYKIFKKAELTYNDFKEISDYSKSLGITFFSTPFSLESVDMCQKLNVPAFKIASGDLTFLPLIKKIASIKKPIIISTGMANMKEINEAIDVIKKEKNEKIIILHSVSSYPTPNTELNINAIHLLQEKFNYPVGFSHNGPGLLVPCIAVGAGAKVIEKHFTLNKKLKGPDHNFSLSPQELQDLVKQIREIEIMLGNSEKKCQPSEKIIRQLARRSITANSDLKRGTILTRYNISSKRPANGLAPKYFEKVLGKRLLRHIKAFEPIKRSDLTFH